MSEQVSSDAIAHDHDVVRTGVCRSGGSSCVRPARLQDRLLLGTRLAVAAAAGEPDAVQADHRGPRARLVESVGDRDNRLPDTDPDRVPASRVGEPDVFVSGRRLAVASGRSSPTHSSSSWSGRRSADHRRHHGGEPRVGFLHRRHEHQRECPHRRSRTSRSSAIATCTDAAENVTVGTAIEGQPHRAGRLLRHEPPRGVGRRASGRRSARRAAASTASSARVVLGLDSAVGLDFAVQR